MADPDETAVAREDRRRRKVWGGRLKLAANYVHAVALAVLGAGVLRFALDPAAAPVGLGRLALVIAASLAVEGAAIYFLGYLRPED